MVLDVPVISCKYKINRSSFQQNHGIIPALLIEEKNRCAKLLIFYFKFPIVIFLAASGILYTFLLQEIKYHRTVTHCRADFTYYSYLSENVGFFCKSKA